MGPPPPIAEIRPQTPPVDSGSDLSGSPTGHQTRTVKFNGRFFAHLITAFLITGLAVFLFFFVAPLASAMAVPIGIFVFTLVDSFFPPKIDECTDAVPNSTASNKDGNGDNPAVDSTKPNGDNLGFPEILPKSQPIDPPEPTPDVPPPPPSTDGKQKTNKELPVSSPGRSSAEAPEPANPKHFPDVPESPPSRFEAKIESMTPQEVTAVMEDFTKQSDLQIPQNLKKIAKRKKSSSRLDAEQTCEILQKFIAEKWSTTCGRARKVIGEIPDNLFEGTSPPQQLVSGVGQLQISTDMKRGEIVQMKSPSGRTINLERKNSDTTYTKENTPMRLCSFIFESFPDAQMRRRAYENFFGMFYVQGFTSMIYLAVAEHLENVNVDTIVNQGVYAEQSRSTKITFNNDGTITVASYRYGITPNKQNNIGKGLQPDSFFLLSLIYTVEMPSISASCPAGEIQSRGIAPRIQFQHAAVVAELKDAPKRES
jgi:hypothetical protein